MKKTSTAGLVVLASVLLTAACMAAEGGNSAAVQPQAQEQGSDKDGVWVESPVSQSRIDAVTKREEAVAQRDEKMRIRERNVQSDNSNTSNLFRKSR